MKRLIIGFFVAASIIGIEADAVEQKENLADLKSAESLVILNEQLRAIRAELAAHEQRLDDGGL